MVNIGLAYVEDVGVVLGEYFGKCGSDSGPVRPGDVDENDFDVHVRNSDECCAA